MGRRTRYGQYQLVDVAFGGTGATTAADARTSLSAAQLVAGVHPRSEIPIAVATQGGSAPAFATTVTVPLATVVKTRRVYGTISLAATGSDAAIVYGLAETGFNTGLYNNVVVASLPAGTSGTFQLPFQFEVLAGRRYKFTKGGAAGVTETVSTFSFTDW